MCDGKHLRLAALIVGIVLAVCGACLGACWSLTSDLEVRVRQVEKADAANAVRFEEIKASLLRLENRKGP
jgi:flagellar basal body-associated protein FliL